MFQRKLAQRFVALEEDQDGFVVKHINKFIGKGVFSSRSFTKGDFLLQYAGEFISYQEGEQREKAYPLKCGSFIYFLTWNNKQYCIDATFSNRICKYVNDGIGQSQNCVMKLEVFKDRPHLCLYANKDIAVGDELRYDYGVPDLPWRMNEKLKNSRNLSVKQQLRLKQQDRQYDPKECTRRSSRAKRINYSQFRVFFPRIQLKKSGSRHSIGKVNVNSSEVIEVQTILKENSLGSKKGKNMKQMRPTKRIVKKSKREEKHHDANLRNGTHGIREKEKKIQHSKEQIDIPVTKYHHPDANAADVNIFDNGSHEIVTEHSLSEKANHDVPDNGSHDLVTEPSLHKDNTHFLESCNEEKCSEINDHALVSQSSMDHGQTRYLSETRQDHDMNTNTTQQKSRKQSLPARLQQHERQYDAKFCRRPSSRTKRINNSKFRVCFPRIQFRRSVSQHSIGNEKGNSPAFSEVQRPYKEYSFRAKGIKNIKLMGATKRIHKKSKREETYHDTILKKGKYRIRHPDNEKETKSITETKHNTKQINSLVTKPSMSEKGDHESLNNGHRKSVLEPFLGEKGDHDTLNNDGHEIVTEASLGKKDDYDTSNKGSHELSLSEKEYHGTSNEGSHELVTEPLLSEKSDQDTLNNGSHGLVTEQSLNEKDYHGTSNKCSHELVTEPSPSEKDDHDTLNSDGHEQSLSEEEYRGTSNEGSHELVTEPLLREKGDHDTRINDSRELVTEQSLSEKEYHGTSNEGSDELVTEPLLREKGDHDTFINDSHELVTKLSEKDDNDTCSRKIGSQELVTIPLLDNTHLSESSQDENHSYINTHSLVDSTIDHGEKGYSSESYQDHDLDTDTTATQHKSRKRSSHGTYGIPSCFVKLQRLTLGMIRDLGYETLPSNNCFETPTSFTHLEAEDIQDRVENHIQNSEYPINISTVTIQPDNMSDRPSMRPCVSFKVHGQCLEPTAQQTENDPDEIHTSNKINSKLFKKTTDAKIAKPYRPCLYCGVKQSKLTRHLKTRHKDEKRIQSVLLLPKALQHEEFDQIKKEGILKTNKDIMQNADFSKEKITTRLMRERRQGDTNLAVCSACNGFYAANTIHKHKRICVGAESSTKEPVSLPVSLIADTGNEKFRDEVLSKFRKDDVGNLCRNDSFIKLFGFQTYLKIRSREEKKCELRDSVMSEMRRFAHLFLEFRSLAKRDKKTVASSIDMLARDNFSYLQEAISNVTIKEDGSIKSGLKAGIGFLLKKTAKVLKGQYLIQKEDGKATEVDNFLTVLQHFWIEIFSDAQYANVKARQTDLRKPKHLPNEEDILKLREFIIEEQKKLLDQYAMITKTEYKCLRDIMVCRLTLFNARRGGEPSRLMLKEWRDAEEDVWIDESAVQKINDPIEKYLLGQYKIAYQSGKNMNQMVPLLIPKDCLKGLKILANEETRSSVGVNSRNIFLFPSTMSSEHHIKGWNAVYNVCKRAGVGSCITATKVRHRAATVYAALDVPDKERELFYKHMGHSEEINRHVYQCPLAVQEVTKIGKFFQNLDRPLSSNAETTNATETSNNRQQATYGTLHEGAKEGGGDDSDIHENDDDMYDDDKDSDYSGESDVSSDDEISFNIKRKGATKNDKKRRRFSWPDEDTRKVREFFSQWVDDTSTFDRKGALPGKKTIMKFLTKYPRILLNMDMEKKWMMMRTKLFNERNKSRNSVNKHLSPMLR